MDPEPDIPLLLTGVDASLPARVRSLTRGAIRTFEPGEVLTWEGERPSCLWVVVAGAVTLTSTAPTGRRATVAVLGRGAVLGEQGVIPRVISVRPDPISSPEARALAPTTASAIALSALHLALASDPRVGRWLTAAVSRRALQVQRGLARTLLMRVPARLLGVLEDLAEEHGRPLPGGVGIELPLTQDLLASMVGATRECVNRAVAQLEREGAVRRIGARYVLPDRFFVCEGSVP